MLCQIKFVGRSFPFHPILQKDMRGKHRRNLFNFYALPAVLAQNLKRNCCSQKHWVILSVFRHNNWNGFSNCLMKSVECFTHLPRIKNR